MHEDIEERRGEPENLKLTSSAAVVWRASIYDDRTEGRGGSKQSSNFWSNSAYVDRWGQNLSKSHVEVICKCFIEYSCYFVRFQLHSGGQRDQFRDSKIHSDLVPSWTKLFDAKINQRSPQQIRIAKKFLGLRRGMSL